MIHVAAVRRRRRGREGVGHKRHSAVQVEGQPHAAGQGDPLRGAGPCGRHTAEEDDEPGACVPCVLLHLGLRFAAASGCSLFISSSLTSMQPCAGAAVLFGFVVRRLVFTTVALPPL